MNEQIDHDESDAELGFTIEPSRVAYYVNGESVSREDYVAVALAKLSARVAALTEQMELVSAQLDPSIDDSFAQLMVQTQ